MQIYGKQFISVQIHFSVLYITAPVFLVTLPAQSVVLDLHFHNYFHRFVLFTISDFEFLYRRISKASLDFGRIRHFIDSLWGFDTAFGVLLINKKSCRRFLSDTIPAVEKVLLSDNRAGRQHSLLSPLDCLSAKAGGPVNGGAYALFISTIGRLGRLSFFSLRLNPQQ